MYRSRKRTAFAKAMNDLSPPRIQGEGSQGSPHHRHLTGRLHLRRGLCALLTSSLTIRSLETGTCILGIAKETARQNLTLLHPSFLFLSAPHPRAQVKRMQKKREHFLKRTSAMRHVSQTGCWLALTKRRQLQSTGEVLWLQIFSPPTGGLGIHIPLQISQELQVQVEIASNP